MLRPNKRVLESLSRLLNDHDFAVVVEWITASREDNFILMEGSTKENFERLQGYGQALRDFLQHSNQARESLSKTGR